MVLTTVVHKSTVVIVHILPRRPQKIRFIIASRQSMDVQRQNDRLVHAAEHGDLRRRDRRDEGVDEERGQTKVSRWR